MAFSYDKSSGLSGIIQYSRYLENDLYIRNLKRYTNDPVNYQLLEIRRTIGDYTSASIENTNRIANETQKKFEELTNVVCGTLEKGFSEVVGELEDINWRLNEVNESIGSLHSMLDWKTDIMIEEQKITNLYLGKVVDLLKIPDSQKQRSHHIERGATWLKNAIEEGPNSDFYTDALDDFLKAKEIEEKDYFSLHKLGIIYLHSKKHLDVVNADEYFRASARYAKALGVMNLAASSLSYASRCNYILGNFPKAVEHAMQAVELLPTNAEYGFQLAKCLSANNQEAEAAKVLTQVIKIDKFYSMKALSDNDFINQAIIRERIQNIATVLISEISDEVTELKSLIVENSIAKEKFSRILEIFHEPTYLNARTVEEELEKVHKWEYIHYSEVPEYFQPLEEKRTESLTISEIIRIEHKEENNKAKLFENFRIANANRARKTKEQLSNRRRRQMILTPLTFIVGVGVWLWSSSLEGWFPGLVIKATAALLTGLVLTKLYDTYPEDKLKKLLLAVVILGSAIGAWIACTHVVSSGFWNFILKGIIINYTIWGIVKVYRRSPNYYG